MRLRRTILAMLLIVGLIASLGGVSAASPDATQAKKCKKGYKKNKKGKCVKKKFAPKYGLFTSKDGKNRLRVDNAGKSKIVRLFGTPVVTLQCTGGSTTQAGIGPPGLSAVLKGKSFSYSSPGGTLTGKFTSTKALKGVWSMTRQATPGITCTSGPQAFKAKRTGN